MTEMDRARLIHSFYGGKRINLPRPQVGDFVSRVLAAVGLSEDFVKKLLKKEDCGCGKRKNAINFFFEQTFFYLELFLNRLLDFVIGDYVSEKAERLARQMHSRNRNPARPPDAKLQTRLEGDIAQ